jgi:hypothetical protein
VSPTPLASTTLERRTAQRLDAGRRLVRVRGVTRAAAQDLVTLDVSANGCRVTGTGTAPALGLNVDVDVTSGPSTPPSRLRAIVVRSGAATFGRFELGLRFTPRSTSERDVVLRWIQDAAHS